MENLQIKITITDGEKDAKASINVEEYQKMKELHGVSLVDEIVDTLLNKIKDSITTNN
jgi:predicted small metal-binding protein